MSKLTHKPLLQKITVGKLSADVTQEIIEDVMHSNFIGVVKDFVPAFKNKNSKTGRVVYKFDFSNYFTMVSHESIKNNIFYNFYFVFKYHSIDFFYTDCMMNYNFSGEKRCLIELK